MNLQEIERLKDLLVRVERNAKLPRTRTQGFGAFIVSSGAATYAVAAPSPVVSAVEPIAPPIPAAPLQPPARAAAAQVTEVQEAPVEAGTPEATSEVEVESESIPLEEVGIEDFTADELGAEEIPFEVTSSSQPEFSGDRPISVSPVVTPFTAPPSLDELTFSEPPPPGAVSEQEIELPAASSAQAASEPPGSIDAALLLAVTEAQEQQAAADVSEADIRPVTPPPESGPQVAVAPLNAPPLPTGISPPHHKVAPTIEQLGDVIELEQAAGPPLELSARHADALPPVGDVAPPEDLEFVPTTTRPSRPVEGREPMQTLVGGLTEEEAAGSGAMGAREQPASSPPVVVPTVGTPPSGRAPESGRFVRPPPKPQPTIGAPTSLAMETSTAASQWTAETVARPVVAEPIAVVDVIAAARGHRPQTFVELLDASLGLLKK